MTINFLLPYRTKSPGGGLKVMYEYANHLADRGHDIRVLHLRKRFQRYSAWTYPLARWLKNIENSFFPFWFQFHKTCKVRYVRSVTDKDMPDADVIIYTWWELGFDVEKLAPCKGIKVNLIQDYEIWTGNTEAVHRSYDLKGVLNIVIASGLRDIVSSFTQKPVFILPNAIDTHTFQLMNPIENRNPASLCMMYHIQERKGTKYGLEALHIVKKRIPGLTVNIFSVFDAPDDLPDWMIFHKKPHNLCQIYNQSAIYITSSLQEGWALPPAEAMHCGCALICTKISGHQDYASKETALQVQPQQPQQMAEAIMELISHPDRRIRLAQAGHQFIQQFSWEKSTTLLESFLKEHIDL
jgi:glycosyltransferase involved in cell wall biosynthesis